MTLLFKENMFFYNADGIWLLIDAIFIVEQFRCKSRKVVYKINQSLKVLNNTNNLLLRQQ